MKRFGIALGIVATTITTSCAPTSDEPPIESDEGVMVQRLRAAPNLTGSSTFVGMDFVATDSSGAAIPCDSADLDLSVDVSFDGGQTYTAVDGASVVTRCGTPQFDVALVIDNSGSQKDVLEKTRDGARAFANEIVNGGGRVSITRVSTDATTVEPLTNDVVAINAALDEMFVNKGWTALYDGIRKGNETLGIELGATPQGFADVGTFCAQGRGFAIVAFTNGEENNSAQQELGTESDDGMNTRLDDLLQLKVNSTQTPIHTIGLGQRVDQGALSNLSNTTGGRHITVSNQIDIPAAFDLLSDYVPATTQVCAEASQHGCGMAKFRVNYTYSGDGTTYQGALEYDANVPCPPQPASGRSVSLLLTLSNPGIAPNTASTLANQALNWAAPASANSVLFVRDDNHHGEFDGDVAYIKGLVDASPGWTTAIIDEPANGISDADVANYDVIWFSNPGWPVDDPATAQTLEQALADGKGVVLSGDDMSWSMGRAFPMTPLTHLNHINNGTRTCGQRTDNNKAANYRVTFQSNTHPVIAGLEGTSFTYGDDIDHTTPAGDGEEVLAWATLDGDPVCALSTPVIVAHQP